MALDTATDLSFEVLESLDFLIPCGHSQHSAGESRWHTPAEAAEYIAEVVHDCPGDPVGLGVRYPCCRTWAVHLQEHAERYWQCNGCREILLVNEMVVIIGKLDTM